MSRPSTRPILLLASLLAVSIVAATIWVALHSRQSPGATQPAAPLMFIQRPPSDEWHAIDWSGNPRGAASFRQVGIPYQSPDGSRLLWSREGSWEIVDGNGRHLTTVDLSTSAGFTWADDSSGICVVSVVNQRPDGGGIFQLAFDPARGNPRAIVALTLASGPNIAACSPGAGRVVITTAAVHVGQAPPVFLELEVVDFRTGVTIRKTAFPASGPNVVTELVADHDGSQVALATAQGTTLLDEVKDQIVDRATGVTPLAYSWDGALLAAADRANRGQILNVATGKVVWHDASDRVTQGAAGNPKTSDLMLFATTGRLTDLVVLTSDGNPRTIASEVFPDQVSPCYSCSAA